MGASASVEDAVRCKRTQPAVPEWPSEEER